MSKIVINGKVFSKNDEELINNVKAVYKDNKITYKLNGIMVNISFFSSKVLITRENDDMRLDLEFEENKNLISKYLIKDLRLNVKVETRTKKIIRNDNNLLIEYDLFLNDSFSDSFTFNLEWSDLK